jgi:hypothetical protein
MADQTAIVFCADIGFQPTVENPTCCFLGNQTELTCSSDLSLLRRCPTGNCIHDCQNVTLLYDSFRSLTDSQVDGPIQQYWACANLPTVAQFEAKNLLIPDLSEVVRQYFPANVSAPALTNVTSAVTKCLTDTCSSARDSGFCNDACQPVNLLTNSTTPNLDGVSKCLFTLCGAGTESLPFASSDIMGIGVGYSTGTKDFN